jgi:hypothetical protein
VAHNEEPVYLQKKLVTMVSTSGGMFNSERGTVPIYFSSSRAANLSPQLYLGSPWYLIAVEPSHDGTDF